MTSMTSANHSTIFNDLYVQKERMLQSSIAHLFANDPARASQYALTVGPLYCDYSKSHIDDKVLSLLFQLAQEMSLPSAIDDLFSGRCVNQSEHRAAIHMALRDSNAADWFVDEHNITPLITDCLAQMRVLSSKVRQGILAGYDGQPIKDVINIGIGGSDLGPLMVNDALLASCDAQYKVHYLSTLDDEYNKKLLSSLNPATTVVIAVSKSMTTQETLLNTELVKQWLVAASGSWDAVAEQCFAVTSKPDRAVALGFIPSHILPFWDWVGGRYSVWSAVGLSIAFAYGMDIFEDFLQGACLMDQHFQQAPLESNLPVILGLIGVWYHNFFDAETAVVLPYSSFLQQFPRYLQQLCMESQGKSVSQAGEALEVTTGPIVWGEAGTNSQHSFHQLLMQGTHVTPVDFILPKHNVDGSVNDEMVAHCLAQAQVMMQGFSSPDVHRQIKGNVPSTMLLLDALTPQSLGALIALYEHKVYVQSVIWDINAFDQWGVERGKLAANDMLQDLRNHDITHDYDPSTRSLLERILNQ